MCFQKVWEELCVGALDVRAALARICEADCLDGTHQTDGEAVVQAPVVNLKGGYGGWG